MPLRLRRGTDAERQSITPKEGELIYVTDTKEVYVGDGTSQGGSLVSSSLSDDTTPSLSGNLDLNGNNIVGTGNINIDGTITATGNINLGDGAEDNVIVGGQISSSLIPDSDGTYNIGDFNSFWQQGYFKGLSVDGEIQTETVHLNRLISPDSSLVYASDTDTISASALVGDLTGSVFGENSQVLVDATDSSLNTSFLKISNSEIAVQTESEGLNFITNQGISVRANNIDGSPTSNLLLLESAKTVANALASPDPGDTLASFGASAFDATADTYQAKSLIATRLDTAGSGSEMDFVVADSTGNLRATFVLTSDGVAESNVFKTGSYANETERDTAIPNPSPGMIIFLAGHDDSTGFPKFQGYDGNTWVDFT